MADIFVSYRRDDSCWSAGRINDHLVAAFGPQRVFFDTLTIEPGADFHEVIGSSVGACRVLLAVIGPGWLRTLAERRGSDNDFVCVEIAEALRRGVRVVPLLIDGAQSPTEDMLPDELKPLARRHAVSITPERCRSEVERLIVFLKGYLGDTDEESAVDPCGTRVATTACSTPRDEDAAAFRDWATAPEMVVVPPGSFMMGSAPDARWPEEEHGPVHEVVVEQPFAVSRFAVTMEEFQAFVDSAAYAAGEVMYTFENGAWMERADRSFRQPGFRQAPRHPVVGASWHDAVAYCAWLSDVTNKPYRLLSEAEWEYCCRAGSTTPYWWGAKISGAMANYDAGAGKGREFAGPGASVPVDAYAPNAWGLFQMHGNVWEWCDDAWHETYAGAPTHAGPWPGGDPGLRVLRGGSWMSVPTLLCSSTRNRERPATRMSTIGFRVARAL